jgi:PKD-like domain
MIEKTTANRSYPKPDKSNFLQDDVTRINSALDLIDTDIHAIKQEQTSLDASKANKTELESKIAALEAKVYSTAYNIIGPPMVFQHTMSLSYSIEIPDATAYAWTATGVTITAGATTKSITVSVGTTSGSLSVRVTTKAGNTITKTKAITVKRLNDIVTFYYTGTIEPWTVPNNVELIKIEAWGGGGDHGYHTNVFKQYGGKGARMKGEFGVNPGDKLLILVGGRAIGVDPSARYIHGSGAGGGGSFVVKVDPDSSHQMSVGDLEKVTPLLIAGGGAGGGIAVDTGQIYDGGDGLTTQNGGDALNRVGGQNGTSGGSSSHGVGGAGFLENGVNPSVSPSNQILPKSFLNGGDGGIYNTWAKSNGGFGGGGGSGVLPGGGGGYSGGAAGGSWKNDGRAAGGGSYNNGTNPNKSEGVQVGNGKVQISW